MRIIIVLCRYMEMDISLYDKCSRDNSEKNKAAEAERDKAANKWQTLTSTVQAKGIDTSALL